MNNRSVMFVTRKIWKFYNQNFGEMHKDKSPVCHSSTRGILLIIIM